MCAPGLAGANMGHRSSSFYRPVVAGEVLSSGMQISATEVVHAFHRAEPRLFIGAASVTVGLVVIGFLLIRRRFDRLLSFFAWFAILYGERLWLQTSTFARLGAPSLFRARFDSAMDFLVAVPAFLFFQEAGLLGRAGRVIAYTVCLLEMALIAAAFAGFPLLLLQNLNSGLVIAGSLPLVILVFRQRTAGRDVVVFRAGLLIFFGFVLWGNTRNLLGSRTPEAPYGFGLFLCCLGYVAAKRALDRDQQLTSLHQELEVAKRIQLSILPTGFPVSQHFSVAARYVPMTAVAGDFYEFLSTGGASAGLLVADVSGHGVPAALIASMVKIATTAQRHHAASPERLLAGVNEALCGSTQGQFVTAAYVYLDAERGELCYAAAGHPPMLLLRDGQVCSIEENGLVLGVFSSATYRSTKQSLRRGDRLLLYTDGVVEAANGAEEEFGHERLGELLATSAGRTVEEMADLILSTVQDWASTQMDDLTVVVCECH
jgi:sigma-B regulation protein RsbU (phosphoserine phosphatase)